MRFIKLTTNNDFTPIYLNTAAEIETVCQIVDGLRSHSIIHFNNKEVIYVREDADKIVEALEAGTEVEE